MRKGAFALLTLWLAGCAAPPDAPPPVEPGPAAPAGVVFRPEFEPLPPEPELCTVLTGLMSKETDGFAELRGPAVAREEWLARQTLPGTESCVIEGDSWPRARYLCAGTPFAAERREIALVEFEELAHEIDRCLQKPIWFPRDWRKGQLFQFAMGERLQTWTDHSTSPPSAVVLKVQQDLTSRDYRVQVQLETVR